MVRRSVFFRAWQPSSRWAHGLDRKHAADDLSALPRPFQTLSGGEQAGVEPFSPHDLRRSTVTHLLDAGVDVFTAQRLAGHADAVTSARYDLRGERAERRAVKSLEILNTD